MVSANSSSSDKLTLGEVGEARSLRRVIWAMTVILSISLATNLLLAYRIRVNRSSDMQATLPLQIGDSVAPFRVSNLDGQQEVISYQNNQQAVVLYVFTPSCIWCTRNLDNLRALVLNKKDSYRFVGISLVDEGVKDYVSKNNMNLPVYSALSDEMKQDYKLGGTPQTLVISPDGKVLQNWEGAYTGQQQSEIERFFDVTLPGLTSNE